MNLTQETIRNEIKKIRNSLSKQEVFSLSKSITDNVLKLNFLLNYKTYFIYNSFKNEVDTSFLISYLEKHEKTIVYPKTIGDKMIAIKPNSPRTIKGQFEITEFVDFSEVDEVDVVFLPLLACDLNKNRIGFGKGYYDKFLSNRNCVKIGLCYDFQVVDSITANAWDVKLDLIITPTKIIK